MGKYAIGVYIPKAVFYAAVQPVSVLVYGVIADCMNKADDNYEAWPSQQVIAERLGVNVRTVGRAIRELKDAGFIRAVKTQSVNRYSLWDSLASAQTQMSLQEAPAQTPVAELLGHELPSVREQEPKNKNSLRNTNPDSVPLVRELTGKYVELYKAKTDRRPPAAWIKSAGAAIKRQLADQRTAAEIQVALWKLVEDRKNPSSLGHVLVDYDYWQKGQK
jgi:DNA-binding Lrp family transcriptional regulator